MVDIDRKISTRPVTEDDYLEFINKELIPVVEKLRLALVERGVEGPASAETDNLASYADTTGQVIKDSGYSVADILLFRAAVTVIEITTATLTLGLTHRGALLLYTNAAGCAVTIPAVFAATDLVYHIQAAAGQVSFTGSGVTVNKQGTLLALTAELNAPAATIFTSSTVCYLSGALEAA